MPIIIYTMNIVETKLTNFKKHIKESVERAGHKLSSENLRLLYETELSDILVRIQGYLNLGYDANKIIELLAEVGGYDLGVFAANDKERALRYIEYFSKIAVAGKI